MRRHCSVAASWHRRSRTRPAQSPTRRRGSRTWRRSRVSVDAARRLRPGRRPEQDRRQAADHLHGADRWRTCSSSSASASPARRSKVENIAAVLVTAELPPFARQGARLDVTASSVGDARSLQGGMLLPTALRGPDGRLSRWPRGRCRSAVSAAAGGGNSVQVNHLTVGRVPGGGLVRSSQRTTIRRPTRSLLVAEGSGLTARAHRVADVDQHRARRRRAHAVDPATVSFKVPAIYRESVPELIARHRAAAGRRGRAGARGHQRAHRHGRDRRFDVRLGPAAVAHGNLSVRIATRYDVSQPDPLSQGETTVVPQEKVDVSEGAASW